jgi:RHS repeat-associated protein
MLVPNRHATSNTYRYGFGGHEKDDDLKGIGNHISFNDYGYDPRIGRRLGVDPITHPNISPYAAFANNPIILSDPDGKSPISIFAKQVLKYGLKKAAKEFIESQIKSRLKSYTKKSFGKQLLKDADDVLEVLDTEWWEYVIEVIPVAGDAYGAASLTKKGHELWKRLDALEKRAERFTKNIERAKKGTSATLKKTMEKSGVILKKGEQAHHIIPKAALDKSAAIEDGPENRVNLMTVKIE